MSRIVTNIESIRALGRLTQNQSELSLRLERLATGLRINRGKDDPAGLIASERLRSEIRGIQQASENSQRAINVLSVAEGALNEVSKLLLEIRSLITSTANQAALSPEEVAANQLQIDAILESIDRIANTTEFSGRKLLNGTMAYNLSSQTTSQVSNVRIYGARLPDSGGVTVSVEVTQSAQLAQLVFQNASGDGSQLGSALTLEVAGNLGTETISFASGQALSAVVAGINNFTSLTGVQASLSNTSQIVLNSNQHGSDRFVSVRTVDGYFLTGANETTRDTGQDVGAMVNGQQADGSGLEVDIRTTAIDMELSLTSGFATQTASASSFTITGGGARFQISPSVTAAGMINLGLPSMVSSNLGNATDGFLSSIKSGFANEVAQGNFTNAEIVTNLAINQVATLRGRLGGFQKNVVETNMNSMQVALENVTASESVIREADMADEISKLTRAQILVQSSLQTLAIANQVPTSVLTLLG